MVWVSKKLICLVIFFHRPHGFNPLSKLCNIAPHKHISVPINNYSRLCCGLDHAGYSYQTKHEVEHYSSKIICIGNYCIGSVDSMERGTVEWNSGMLE